MRAFVPSHLATQLQVGQEFNAESGPDLCVRLIARLATGANLLVEVWNKEQPAQ